MNGNVIYILLLLASGLPCLFDSCVRFVIKCYEDTYAYDLGDGFILYDYSSLSGDKVFSKTRNHEEYLQIPPEIIEYKYDDQYIIVKQNLEGKWPESLYAYYDEQGEDLERNEVFTDGWDCDYYWLIVKPERISYGPIDSLEFYNLLDVYQVPLCFED